jgi:hypothetical protein
MTPCRRSTRQRFTHRPPQLTAAYVPYILSSERAQIWVLITLRDC